MKKRDFFTLGASFIFDMFLIEQLKGRHNSLNTKEDEYINFINEKIDSEGMYHFTDTSALSKIIKSKKIKTSKGIFRNHSTDGNRVYMFGGMPDVNSYMVNLDTNYDPLVRGNKDIINSEKNMVYTALNVEREEEDIDKLSKRFADGIVTYKGEMDLEQKIKDGKVSISYLMFYLNEAGELSFKEVLKQKVEQDLTKEQIDEVCDRLSKENLPSEELLSYIDKNKKNSVFKNIDRIDKMRDVAYDNLGDFFKKKIEILKGRFNKNKTLPESHNDNEIVDNVDNSSSFFENNLKKSSFSENEIINNYKKREMIEDDLARKDDEKII